MIEIIIPGREAIRIEHIVFDVNGTIALDGHIDEQTKKRLVALKRRTAVYLLTADTYGTVEQEMAGTGIVIQKIQPGEEAEQKESFIKTLGARRTAAIGNGENDAGMLKRAALGICVIAEEGASARAIGCADLVVHGRGAALGLLERPKRIAATLRK